MLKIILNNINQMQTFGNLLAKYLEPSDVIKMDGDLGAGKTSLSQSIIKSLGYQGDVVSPTFTIIEAYQIDTLKLYHVDVYRLEDNPMEVYSLGLDEYLNDNSIVIVEWAKLIEKDLPKDSIKIEINRINDDRRELILESKFESELIGDWINVNTCN